VTATDAAGNADATPASRNWTIDLTAPETSISSGPTGSVQATDATLTFSADEAGSSFQCSLDGAAFTTCTSPKQYSGLALGAHTFSVRATDPSGNTDASAATRTWTVVASCAGPVTVTANADSWVTQGSAGNNFGTDSILKVRTKSGDNARALVKFPLANVPAGCVVDTATLKLYADSVKPPRTLQAFRIAANWAENAVTWTNQPGTSGTAALATITTGKAYLSWTVTDQVKAMYSSGNNGFLIRDQVENNDSEQSFFGREKGENPPQLIITFRPQ
jgi:hypothetical protein